MIQDFDNNQELTSQEDNLSEVEEEFAEEQLKVNSDATVDFAFQIDNMNQEDVYKYYEAAGHSWEDASEHAKGIDFKEQVRQETHDPGTELVQYQNPEAFKAGQIGNYTAPLDENTTPSKVGIQNDNLATQNREKQIVITNGPLTTLRSTANTIEAWDRPSETYVGGGIQEHVSDFEKQKLSTSSSIDPVASLVAENSVSARFLALDGPSIDRSAEKQAMDISPDLSPPVAESATSVNISPALTLPSAVESDSSASTSKDLSPDLSQPSTASPSTTIPQTPDNSFDDGSNS